MWVTKMRGLDWLVQVGEARIQRQFDVGDAIDAKAGILFAYCGALAVAAAQLGSATNLVLMWLSIDFAIGGAGFAGVMLWPRDFRDPPDLEKLEKFVRDEDDVPSSVIEALVDDQAKAVTFNEATNKTKAFSLKAVLLLSAIATFLLGWEIGQGRGT